AFTWTMFVTGVVWLVTLPIVIAVLVLAYLDIEYGADNGSVRFLGWAFGSPQVFAFALPALGLLFDVVPVSAGVRQRSRGVVLGARGAAATVTSAADQIGAVLDPGTRHAPLAIGAAFGLVLALLALGGAVASTLRAGSPSLSSPLLFGTFAYLLL